MSQMSSIRNWGMKRVCAITSLVAGLVAHGFIIFSKISIYDDAVSTFALGAPPGQGTYTSGRWALGLVGGLIKALFGENVSLPIINGLLGVIFIGVAAYTLLSLFKVNNTIIAILTVAIMQVFPSVTSIYAYMFTAPYYFLSLLLSATGASCIVRFVFYEDYIDVPKSSKLSSLLLGVLAVVLSLGIYQAFFPVATTIVLVFGIVKCLKSENDTISLFKRVIVCHIILVIALVTYMIINKIVLKTMGYSMSTYQGLNSIYSLSPRKMLKVAFDAFLLYFSFARIDYLGIFSQQIVRVAAGILQAVSYLIIALMLVRRKHSIFRWALTIILSMVLPVYANMIVIFTSNGNGHVHTLMAYGTSFVFIFPLMLVGSINIRLQGIMKLLRMMVVVSIGIVVIAYVFYANAAYFKLYTFQEHATAFYNRLIVRIESTPGYSPNMPVLLSGEVQPNTYCGYPELDFVKIHPYQGREIITTSWYAKHFMHRYNGYNLNMVLNTVEDIKKVEASREVGEMQLYPGNNSLKCIDGILVVKFSSID